MTAHVGENTESLVALEEQWGAHNYHPLDIVVERGEGPWLFDVDGKRYLDCLRTGIHRQYRIHSAELRELLAEQRKLVISERARRKRHPLGLRAHRFEDAGMAMSLIDGRIRAQAVEVAFAVHVE